MKKKNVRMAIGLTSTKFTDRSPRGTRLADTAYLSVCFVFGNAVSYRIGQIVPLDDDIRYFCSHPDISSRIFGPFLRCGRRSWCKITAIVPISAAPARLGVSLVVPSMRRPSVLQKELIGVTEAHVTQVPNLFHTSAV